MSFSISKALKHRAILLAGDEEVLRRRAMRELIAAATAGGDDFDLSIIDADSQSVDEWLAGVSTSPFLSERRTVIVRHLLRCDEAEKAAASIKSLPDFSLLVLVADEEVGDDSRQRRFVTIRKQWEKVVNNAGGLVETFATNAKTLPETLRQEAQNLGSTMSPAAAATLAEMTGGSLSRAFDELEKLSLFVGDGKPISEMDVRDVVVASREWNVFKLVEAVVGGEVPAALRQLRILVGGASKPEDAAYSQVLPMLSRQLRLIWQARMLLDHKTTIERAPEDLIGLFPEKPNFAKEPEYRQGRIFNIAKRTPLSTLARCFQILSDADARLKGQLPAFSPIETLERMILEMIQTVSPSPARR